jgi:hypothetical protein
MMDVVPFEEMGSSLVLSSTGRTNTLFSMDLNLFSRMLEGILGISASSDDWQPPIAVIIMIMEWYGWECMRSAPAE